MIATVRRHKYALRAAFNEMRRQGIAARFNVNGCCRSCIWAEHEEWEGKPVFWNFAGQGNRVGYDAMDNIDTHDVLWFYHNSEQFPAEIANCAEILRQYGFDVVWDGNPNKAVQIVLNNEEKQS